MAYNIFCDPNPGSSLRSCGGVDSGNIFGNCSAILGGIPASGTPNINCGDLSVIVMGDNNIIGAGGNYSFIGGGANHAAGGLHSFIGGGNANGVSACGAIGGGCNNNADYPFAAIMGGKNNVAGADATFIGGGDTNTILGNPTIPNCSSIVGGQLNNIGCATVPGFIADYSFIGGGLSNNIFGCKSSIVGGENHVGNGNNIFIGGGDTNIINPVTIGVGPIFNAAIAGGNNNTISDDGTNPANVSFIGGGIQNNVFGAGSSIVGGALNNVCGCGSLIGGGESNLIDLNACGSVIAGGGYYDFVIALSHGNCILSDSCFSFIGGGSDNLIDVSSCYSFIGGGFNHCINGIHLSIGGGSVNCICSGSSIGAIFDSTIAGGKGNFISDDTVNTANASFIGGGLGNSIFARISTIGGGTNNETSGCVSFIGGGDTNIINGASDCSFIGGGTQNNIIGCSSFIGGGGWYDFGIPLSHGNCLWGNFGFIGGGSDNFIDNTGAATSYGVIGGGCQNYIAPGTNFVSIFGGSNHCANGNNLFIGGGDTNYICSTLAPVLCSTIVGGVGNIISDDGISQTADMSFIGGGNANNMQSIGSSIVGGVGNSISGNVHTSTAILGYSFIGGGCQNNVGLGGDGAMFSFIGGGCSNTIDDTGAITQYGVIGGGQSNTISRGTHHSSIFGGNGNTIAGSCSSILGGSGNSDGGNPYVGIFGCNVTGVQPCAFHANTFVAQNMVSAGTPVPTGTLYYCFCAVGCCPVFVC